MAQDNRADIAHLERVVIDAYYLGHALAALGGRGDFLLAGPTRLVAHALLTFAEMASRSLEGGGGVFVAEAENKQKSAPPQELAPRTLAG